MFKKLLIIVLFALPFCAFAQTPQFKFGTVNTMEIFSAMPEREAAQKEYDALAKKYEDEFLKMQEEFGKKYKELMATQDSISIPENIKARRQQELAELNQRIQNFQDVVQNDLAKQQQQLLAPVEKKMRDAIKAVGDEYKFTYLFDLNAVLFAGASSEDATPLVKAKLGLK